MKYIKGQSGNPKGRPKGTVKIEPLRKALYNEIPEIITALVDQAKAGDTSAARLLLDRVFPALKPQTGLLSISTDGTPVDQASAVIKAMLSGMVSTDTGNQALNAMLAKTRIIESEELIKRIEALENDHST